MRRRAAVAATIILSALGMSAAGCAGSRRGAARADPATGLPRLFDASTVYRAMGFLVGGAGLPFVASIRYLAGPHPDSTLALFSVSLPNNAITFQRQAGAAGGGADAAAEFVAAYRVEAAFRDDTGSRVPVRQIGRNEQVRVRSFQETLRTDESVIFQQFVTVPPGEYQVQVMVRDRNGPAVGRAERADTVPRFAAAGLTLPIPVYAGAGRAALDEFPELLSNPRATLPYGGDSVHFYIETYGQAPGAGARLLARVVDDRNRELWRDTVPLVGTERLAAARVAVAPATLPVGRADLVTTVLPGGDTTRARFLVSFSNQWVITNFDEMTSLLRYFPHQEWLDSLRNAPPERRPERWREFWRATDPVAITPDNESLDEYFRRVQQANIRFADEGEPGWLTDRGEVFITLGEPDEVLDMMSGFSRDGFRAIRWEYREHRLILIFHDQTGFGRFRMTATSRAEYMRVLARVRRPQ